MKKALLSIAPWVMWINILTIILVIAAYFVRAEPLILMFYRITPMVLVISFAFIFVAELLTALVVE